MSLYKSFKTDTKVERDGLWLEYGFADEQKQERPIRILVARAGGNNVRYAKLLEAKTKPHRRAFETGTIQEAVALRLMIEVYAESVLLGWENVDDEDGQPLTFNKENAVKVLTELPDLFQDIRTQANKAALFREHILEADQGN